MLYSQAEVPNLGSVGPRFYGGRGVQRSLFENPTNILHWRLLCVCGQKFTGFSKISESPNFRTSTLSYARDHVRIHMLFNILCSFSVVSFGRCTSFPCPHIRELNLLLFTYTCRQQSCGKRSVLRQFRNFTLHASHFPSTVPAWKCKDDFGVVSE